VEAEEIILCSLPKKSTMIWEKKLMITQYITYMAIKIQNKDIESVFVGKRLVNRIYLGAKIV
jgi:uncharacterized protein YaiL (DUF2058 family)